MADYWDTIDGWIAWMKDQYDTGSVLLGTSRSETDEAFDEWFYGDPDWGFAMLCYAMYDLQSSMSAFLNIEDGWGDVHPFQEFVYQYCVTNMENILKAMLQAEFTELKQFVGIVDAYRATIWDQPFEAQYYADLVRMWRT